MATSLGDPVRRALEEVLDTVRGRSEGDVASYIPELANVDADQLGAALVSTNGVVHEAGDVAAEFTIQSVSKPFVFALVADELGLDQVRRHVDFEPSGEPFNAISLDEASGRPLNPLINAGAIVMTSLMKGETADEKFAAVRTGLERFAGRGLRVDEAVFSSEASTGDRNRALGYLTRSAGTLGSSVEVATTAYFRQCSLVVNVRDLAVMAATLATGGINPLSRRRVISEQTARWTTSVMTSCGMYDESGDWMVRIGLPAKSGVGGGIAAVRPGQFGIGTFSPRLDARGNSVRGVATLEVLSRKYGLHLLQHHGSSLSPIASLSPAAVDGARDKVAILRGEIHLSEAELILTRLAPLVGDHERLALDFSAVTRVAEGTRNIFSTLPAALGRLDDGRTRVEIRDPNGILQE